MHLQRLDEKILGIPTIRTRQRQMSTPSGVCHARQECIAFFRAAGPNSMSPRRPPMPASAGNLTSGRGRSRIRDVFIALRRRPYG
jgi:hypothetical protein